LSSKYLVIEI